MNGLDVPVEDNPPDSTGHVLLHRVTLQGGDEAAFLAEWRAAVGAASADPVLDAYLEIGIGVTYVLETLEAGDTGPLRSFTWLTRPGVGTASAADEVEQGLSHAAERFAPREVVPEALGDPAEHGAAGMVVMRRYEIHGDWDEFLAVWRQVAAMRERHGFHVLFAVGDRPGRLFTWAFSTEETDFQHFLGEGQRGYYADPRRVELETINASLRRIALIPARRILP